MFEVIMLGWTLKNEFKSNKDMHKISSKNFRVSFHSSIDAKRNSTLTLKRVYHDIARSYIEKHEKKVLPLKDIRKASTIWEHEVISCSTTGQVSVEHCFRMFWLEILSYLLFAQFSHLGYARSTNFFKCLLKELYNRT